MASGPESQNPKQPAPRATTSGSAGATRRQFMQGGAAAAIAAMSFPHILPAQARGANDRIRVASVGVGGKGGGDVDHAARNGCDIVALCDVDESAIKKKTELYPKAKTYRDFRKLFSEMADGIDAVTVSTPDHCHGLAAATAMSLGKHVYCQKPLTQTVHEARALRKLAQQKKLATQMGNQGSAGDGLRRAVEVIQAGIIGNPVELHVWSNRPIWPQGVGRPQGTDEVPKELDWDLWLGPAKERPFKQGTYHPFNWRGWYDFGTGALGDMACHTVNMPFRALKLGYPNVVECEKTSELNNETFPKTSRIRFEFPERDGLPPLKFWWYDGSPGDKTTPPLRPTGDTIKNIVAYTQGNQGAPGGQGQAGGGQRRRNRDVDANGLPPSGALIIGEKGQVYSPDDYGLQFFVKLNDDKTFVSGDQHEAAKAVKKSIPRAPGKAEMEIDEKQKVEWIRMIRDGTPSYSNFDVAAYLTEIILLGCIAMRVGVGRKMDWDGPAMRSTNVSEAAQFVRRNNRKGWEDPTMIS
jgi:hypothetical protein